MTSNQTVKTRSVWRRSVYILRTLHPFTRGSRGWFFCGCLAALGVVAARIALPWPLRGVTDRWISGDSNAAGSLTALVPEWADYVLWMGSLFLVVILLLGLFDFLGRLYFARFAIGTVRDIRAKAFESVMSAQSKGPDTLATEDGAADPEEADEGEELEVRTKHSGDLVARLVGDSARVKAGLQGFLVHVATNSVAFLGATVILFMMDVSLGLIFAAAGICTATVTIWSAARLFRRSVKHRKKEGKLAQNIHQALENDPADAAFVRIDKASGRHEAALTRIQGIATWSAHVVFGVAVLAALWVGSRSVEAGDLAVGDMVVMMMYALLMRGPIVRLARQGSRTGKILGTAHRLVQMLEMAPKIQTTPDKIRLKRLRNRLQLSGIRLRPAESASGWQLGPIDVEIKAGERLAIAGPPGCGKSVLLSIIAGVRQPDEGHVSWDGVSATEITPRRWAERVVYLPRDDTDAPPSTLLNQRLRHLAKFIYRRSSVWLFDDPTLNLSDDQASELLDVLLSRSESSTVVIATGRDTEIDRFDRVLHLDQGRVLFDGTPAQWRRFQGRGTNVVATILRSVGGAASVIRH